MLHSSVDHPVQLEELLRQAQTLGFMGPARLEKQIYHSMAFARLVADLVRDHPDTATRIADLGSGGGLPGLVLALDLGPAAVVHLIEASSGRSTFLEGAARALGLNNCVVLPERAESVGRDPERRASFEVVTARAFGTPGLVAECAAPLLKVGGSLIVSEPPRRGDERWPEREVARFGLAPADRVEIQGTRFAVLKQEHPCPDGYPRRIGVPEKRPVF